MNWLKMALEMSVLAVRLHIAALCVHHTWEGLPAIGVMLWLSIPMGVGGGTTPMSAPTGVPALGEFCAALSRSCCSATLAARSESNTKDKNNLMFHGEPEDIEDSVHMWFPCTLPSYSAFLVASRFLHSVPTSRLSSPKEKSGCWALMTALISLLKRMYPLMLIFLFAPSFFDKPLMDFGADCGKMRCWSSSLGLRQDS